MTLLFLLRERILGSHHGEPPHTERFMCMTHVNDNHIMIIYLKDCCPIPRTCPLWRQHARDDVKS